MSVLFKIQHLSGSLAGQSQRVALDEGQVLRLGRGPENDIKFSDTRDDSVSSVHAELTLAGSRLYIEDKRSSNGTFLNGAPCPPFQKLAVPDGARLRLAKQGPEMQVTPGAGASATPAAPPPLPTADSSLPKKEVVGRQTLLREIERAKQEERDAMVGEVTRTRRSTGLWMGLGALVLLLLVGAGFGLFHWYNRGQMERQETALEDVGQQVEEARITWPEVERAVSPAAVYIRCQYHLRRSVPIDTGNSARFELRDVGGESAGSGILIKPGILLTAKHVVEPWKTAIESWDQFAQKAELVAEYDLLDVQFPGRQPLVASLVAVAENVDLALLQVAQNTVQPVPMATSNDVIRVTDEVAIISYPASLGQYRVLTQNFSGFGSPLLEVKNVHPTFLTGRVTLPLTATGETSHHFSLDASVEPGSSGGAVLDREGKIIGIIASAFQRGEPIRILGEEVITRVPMRAGVQAISPEDIQSFLRRTGIF